jgi:hypothetical protein
VIGIVHGLFIVPVLLSLQLAKFERKMGAKSGGQDLDTSSSTASSEQPLMAKSSLEGKSSFEGGESEEDQQQQLKMEKKELLLDNLTKDFIVPNGNNGSNLPGTP